MKIHDFIYTIDKLSRDDLSKQMLISERDFVSQFNTLIRYPTGVIPSKKNPIYSQTLNGKHEQILGCDSIMIFKLKKGFKIGLFEAKYPRYERVNKLIKYNHWDSNNRFNSQLNRQQKALLSFPQLIIWEHFIDNGLIGKTRSPFIDKFGSSVILFNNIIKHKPPKGNKWGLKELKTALKSDGINLKKLIKEILNCTYGEVMKPIDKSIRIKNENKTKGVTKIEEFTIPIDIEDNNKIIDFMKQYGLSNYYFINSESELTIGDTTKTTIDSNI